jgi:indole-3-glycerol phosphate synthase
VLLPDLRPADLAHAYEAGGAAALSVLTDRRFFSGDHAHLAAARGAVAIPVLRKDFTLAPYHVYEARAMGADAVLLIASILDDASLLGLRRLAESLHMAALVEVHTEGELDRALGAGARIVGINNRNLRTFAVSIETTLRLRPRIPSSVTVVSESGISEPDQLRRLREAGVDAVLIGSALVAHADPTKRLRELREGAASDDRRPAD